MKDLIYLVWQTETSGDEDCSFWMQYDSLEDAVNEHTGEPIYTARPRLLGKFRKKMVIKRIKKKK